MHDHSKYPELECGAKPMLEDVGEATEALFKDMPDDEVSQRILLLQSEYPEVHGIKFRSDSLDAMPPSDRTKVLASLYVALNIEPI